MSSEHRKKLLFTLNTVFFIFGFSLTACSSPQYWAKPGAKAGDFDRDMVDCKRTLAGSQGRGFSAGSLNPAYGIPQSAVDQCMGQKGWYLADKPSEVEPVDPPR